MIVQFYEKNIFPIKIIPKGNEIRSNKLIK